jgi:hypothetical protein
LQRRLDLVFYTRSRSSRLHFIPIVGWTDVVP